MTKKKTRNFVDTDIGQILIITFVYDGVACMINDALIDKTVFND